MAPHVEATVWLRPAGRLGLVLAVVLSASTAVSAQAPGTERTYYTQSRSFQIPFDVDPGGPPVKKVVLHVSEDYGKSYQEAASAPPTEKFFRFQARQDGWYWFAVQTVDTSGRAYPANVNLATPGLKVCVDTQPPVVTVRAGQSKEAAAAFDWDVRDEYLDLQTLRADYRPANGTDRDWVPLPVPQTMTGHYEWNPPGAGAVEVRIQVKDRAGNVGKGSSTLTPTPGRTGATPTPEPARGNVLWVNSKRIQLNYKIEDQGPSGVKTVEVWYTEDPQCKTWTKYPQDANGQPPYTIDVDHEGRYGFTLVARSGVDFGEPPPKPGDQPQVWVEVDTTKPKVTVLRAEPGRGLDKGKLFIEWTATDKFLRARPITLSYAENPTGPWKPIVTNSDNTRQYVWQMPDGLPFQFHVRVEAIDEAGNVGSDTTNRPVKVDLAIPKVRVISVEPVAPQGTGDRGPGTGGGDEKRP
jgi:hypothetical protein